MKSNKHLYTFFQKSKNTNDDYMKGFGEYVKVIEYYGGGTPMYPVLVKSKLLDMEVQETDNPTPE